MKANACKADAAAIKARPKSDQDSFSLLGASTLSAFVVDANDAMHFNIARSAKNWDKRDDGGKNGAEGGPKGSKEEDEEEESTDVERVFHPEMSHQIYGEQENIFGYRNLRIHVTMSAATLKATLKFECDETLPCKDGVAPDPVLEPILKILAPEQVALNDEDFRKELEKEKKFKPMGKKMGEWNVPEMEGDGNDADRFYEIYLCDSTVAGFRDYHARLQPWILFYIDAASYIDFDDDHWRFFVLFERYKSDDDGSTRYAVAGYTTVYQYYGYPTNMRPRISQMLVLPPFQKQGLGAKMLDAVQRHFWKDNNVIDITVEDPSEDFVRLRDFVDCQNCSTLEAFKLENLKNGFSVDMVTESNESFKVCKRQARRVYEILRLKSVNREAVKEYKTYRVGVKRRLNIPYQKEERQLSKLRKVLSADEYAAATLNITNHDQRLESLRVQYEALEAHYLRIVDRLADEEQESS